MSTNCHIIVADKGEKIGFLIFRHFDGYPGAVVPELEDALEYAWPLPQFEADDFAAAIVAAWKPKGGGDIRLAGTIELKDKKTLESYVYVISQLENKKIQIQVFFEEDKPIWTGILGENKYEESEDD